MNKKQEASRRRTADIRQKADPCILGTMGTVRANSSGGRLAGGRNYRGSMS